MTDIFVTPAGSESEGEDRARRNAEAALRLVCASSLPHLAGLAHAVELRLDNRVSVAAVTQTGRVLVNSIVFAALPMAEATFILAHELMHLVLDTHGRRGDADPMDVNFAHDYIINDLLYEELRIRRGIGRRKRGQKAGQGAHSHC